MDILLCYANFNTILKQSHKIYDKMTGLSGFNYPIAGREFYKLAITNDGVEPSDATIKAACKSFSKYIY